MYVPAIIASKLIVGLACKLGENTPFNGLADPLIFKIPSLDIIYLFFDDERVIFQSSFFVCIVEIQELEECIKLLLIAV